MYKMDLDEEEIRSEKLNHEAAAPETMEEILGREADSPESWIVELSVRTLVEFVLKSGSIDKRYSGRNRMLEGAEIHRKVQHADEKAKNGYHSEVTLSGEEYFDDFCFRLSGRADAVYTENGRTVIEELKSTGEDLDELELKEVHKAQLYLYGLLWMRAGHQDAPVLELTYVHLRNGKRKSFRFEEDLESLAAYSDGLLEQFIRWARLEQDWKKMAAESADQLDFVFGKFRKGQREMNLAVWNTLKRREHLLLQAPTGIGKTISALFPSVKMLGKPYSRIFYLTARTQTQREAEKAAALMREKGLKLKSVLITAKEKMCPLTPDQEMSCEPDHCPYAKDYYDKINPILYDLLMTETEFSEQRIREIGETHSICPFELSLDLALWADLIICDYNYVFDPSAALIRFEESRDNIYLIDEAHNLPDRSRDMYSAQIDDLQIEKLIRSAEQLKSASEIGRCGDRILSQMRALLGDLFECEPVFLEAPAAALNDSLEELVFASDRWYARLGDRPMRPDEELFASVLSDTVVMIRKYLLIGEFYADNYLTRVAEEDAELTVTQICLDASSMIRDKIGDSGSGILFSATFSPFSYYRSVLGFAADTPALALPSPFPGDNVLLLSDGSVSTRFKDRGASARRIAEDIYALVDAKPGNYMIFFPSFRYLSSVLEQFEKMTSSREDRIRVLEQHADMSQKERNAFIGRLRGDKQKNCTDETETIAAFCVMGGAFSEGIDLPGESLIGAVIVSPGIPALSPERRKLKDYYDTKLGAGYDFAYKYPGMNKVLQSAGRVIRTESDCGVLLFIDDRLSSYTYYDLFPEHLRCRRRIQSPEEIKKAAKNFWKTK